MVSWLALGTSAPLVQRGSLLALFSSLWKLNIENRRAGSGHTCTHACVLLLPWASVHFLQSVPIRAAQNSERKFPEVGANENLLAVFSPYKVVFRVPWLLIIWAFPLPFPLHSALLQTAWIVELKGITGTSELTTTKKNQNQTNKTLTSISLKIPAVLSGGAR